MATILFVATHQASAYDKEIIHEVYYDTGRFYHFYGASKVPKTVRRFMDTATTINNIWNKTLKRREIVYKA